MSTATLAYWKKALTAGALAALAALLAYNIPGWISGDEAFEWRSVLAGLVAAAIAGVATWRVRNGPAPGETPIPLEPPPVEPPAP